MKMRWMGMLLLSLPLFAHGAAVADVEAHKHMGVASCANSVCHGASQPFKESHVMQNEFAYWQEFDPHATKAFQVLRSERGRSIASKLGIGDPTGAKICIDCHADNTPESNRGEKFQLSDGVGCEACHGGSEQWLSAHADKSVKHADNLAKGMYPTDNPVKRAQLCLTCHMGTADRMITHRIMGAGHPRLSFELDTFTWLNPHYKVDEDYTERKGNWNGVRDWGLGQGIAAANLLDLLVDDKAGMQGIFPELVLFDCHACHKPMGANKWGPRQGTGLGPGVVRLNDSNLVMFRHVLATVDKAAADRVRDQTRALHQATTKDRSSTVAAAKQLAGTIRGELDKIAAHDFQPGTLGQILQSIVDDADRGEFRDYSAAEQAAMASQSVVVAFQNNGKIDEQRSKLLQNRVDALYATVDNGDNFAMPRFVAALKELRQAAP